MASGSRRASAETAPAPDLDARGLASEAEVAPWAALCGRGFSHRPGDPERFLHRYRADPTAKLAWTRVAVAPGGAFVGSVRIFDRVLDVAGSPARCAGWGEVCTDPSMRGRGVANVVLPDAVDFCERHTGATFSALHAAPAVNGLYARHGYVQLHVPYGLLSLPSSSGSSSSSQGPALEARGIVPAGEEEGGGGAGLYLAEGDLGRDWHLCAPLHDDFVAALGTTGHTLRSPAYWARWLAYIAAGATVVLASPASGGPPLAYAVVTAKPEGFRLADFGAAPTLPRPAARWIMLAALRRASARDTAAAAAVGRHEGRGTDDVATAQPAAAPPPPAAAATATPALDPTERQRRLLVPLAVLEWAQAGHEGAAAEAVVEAPAASDAGWMVRPLSGGLGGRAAGDAAVAALVDASARGRFLVWVADAF